MEPSLRPSISIGHVMLKVSDVPRSADFYGSLGLRPVFQREDMAILELRGGTHLMLFKARRKSRRASTRLFDFMVDDADAFHGDMTTRGVPVGPIREDRVCGHRMFELTDPDGHVLTVFSDHTEGRAV